MNERKKKKGRKRKEKEKEKKRKEKKRSSSRLLRERVSALWVSSQKVFCHPLS